MRSRASRLLTLLVCALVGSFVLAGCRFNGAYDLPLPGNKVSKDDSIAITADFADALNVVPRTSVMVDDVAVGQVTQVDRVGWHARVQMRVRKDLKLPANVEADVRQTSLLGEKYIALIDPPAGTASSERLKAGAKIPLSATGRNPEVEEVLGALSMLLTGGGVGQLHTITVELNNMLNGRQDKARDLLDKLNALIGTLDGQKNDIITAMEAVDKLASTLVRERKTLTSALDAMGPALKVLNDQHATLMKMLRQLDKLGVVGTRVIRNSKDNIVATLRHLGPALKGLADAGDSLPKGLALLASFPFPKEAANIAMGDYANALFHLDINLDKLLKSPGNELPNVLNVCSATPLDPLCQALSKDVLDELCPQLPVDSILCNKNTTASKPLNVPNLLPKNKKKNSGGVNLPGVGGLGGLGRRTPPSGLIGGGLGGSSGSSPGSSSGGAR